MNIVKRSKDDIQKAMVDIFTEYFDNPLEAPEEVEEDDEPGSVEFDELNLVDLNAFEDWLSIETIIRAGSELYSTQLECLTIRYANMIKEEDIDNVVLPIHVKQICLAFQKSLEKQLIAHEVAPEIYNFFSERVIGKLAPVYSSLNTLLREGGVLPDLENDIQKRGSAFVRRKSAKNNKKEKQQAENDANADQAENDGQSQGQVNPQGQVNTGAAQKAGNQGASSEDRLISELTNVLKQHFDPSNLYNSVIEAMDFNNSDGMPGAYHSPGPGPGGGQPMSSGGGQPMTGGGGQITPGTGASAGQYRIADEITLANALNQLQQNPQAHTSLNQTPSIRNI